MRYLFICLANSCRSIMAEAVARTHLKDGDSVNSCGLSTYPVHKLTTAILEKNGLSAQGLDSKRVDADLIHNADVIVLLDKTIKNRLRLPENKIVLENHIEDPIAYVDDINALEAFQKTFDAIKTLTQHVINPGSRLHS